MKDVMFSLIEVFISLIVETIILGGVFTFVSNKATQQHEQNLKSELKVIEDQNKTTFEQLQVQIVQSRNDILSQIKESSGKGGIG
jgi:Tfp pilus assembly protein PilV